MIFGAISNDRMQAIWSLSVLAVLGVFTFVMVKHRNSDETAGTRTDLQSHQAIIVRTSTESRILTSRLKLKADLPAIVEFMDFECPPCRQSWPKFKAILHNHPKLQYRAVNYPLTMHPNAFGAAVAEEVATKVGKGTKVFDDLFTGKTELDAGSLNKYLAIHGLPPIIGTDLAKPFNILVRQDMKLASDLHVEGTPTVFLLSRGGKLTEVRDLSRLAGLIN